MNPEPEQRQDVIAIDGPAASGKSTIGYMLAQQLGLLYLDTGSMYRAATLAVLQRALDPHNEAAVTELVQSLAIEILPAANAADGRQYTVMLDGRDVTAEIRQPDVDAAVSLISSYQGVRQEMVRRQREYGRRGRVVMVGRDIGTVVLPEAALKLYITASAEERAQRRWRDRQALGHDTDYEEILADVNRRDAFDSNRSHSPLRPAADAILIDSTGRSPEYVLQTILWHVQDAGFLAGENGLVKPP